MSRRLRIWLICGLTLGAVLAMFLFVPPIPQTQLYHLFADRRPWMGIPNFGNVASNLAFSLVGAAGLGAMWRGWFGTCRIDEGASMPFAYFFVGVAFVGPGSAWYHLHPTNATLFWDRLPMTVAFMALLAAVLSDRISRKWTARGGLNLLVAVGIASLLWWDIGESWGAGDLRAYALVQFWPVVLIPLVLWLFPQGRYVRGRYVAAAFGFYLVAKLLEHYDQGVLTMTGGIVSGHTLKHLVAALAPATIVVMICRLPTGSDRERARVEAR
jgi:hypothetical protein